MATSIVGNLKANEAKKTIIYFVENSEVQKSNLYDFVMQSVDETTSPKGVGPRLFYEEIMQTIYISNVDNTKITEDDYENLDNEETRNFDYLGEEILEYEIYSWGAGGNNKKSTGYSFNKEEEAIDYLFNCVYYYDFQEDCNRNIDHYYSKEEAEERLYEIFAEEFNVSVETAKSIYSKKLKINARIKFLEEEKKTIFQNSKKRSEADMIEFISENKELIETKIIELDKLKFDDDKVNWQIKANALIQIVSKNDFRTMKWKEIYNLIKFYPY